MENVENSSQQQTYSSLSPVKPSVSYLICEFLKLLNDFLDQSFTEKPVEHNPSLVSVILLIVYTFF